MPSIILKTNKKIYSGWLILKVQRGIEQAAGAFAVELTERWPAQAAKWPIEPGDACELLLDNIVVITGYVDSTDRKMDASEHTIRVIGRDKTADIVDCAALQPGDRTDSVQGQTLLQIATQLCKPYDVTISSDMDVDLLLKTFNLQPTETVWENIETQARKKAVLIISDGKGGLLITRAGKTTNPTALVEGDNVLSASLLRDNSQRFSRYIIRGQTPGTYYNTPAENAHGEAKITDPAITRNRVMLFQPDSVSDSRALKDRVKWERNIRRGKSRRVRVSVNGWSAGGQVWQPNELVQINIPTLGISGPLLLVSLTHTLDDRGKITEMVFSPQEAYDLIPEQAKSSTSSSSLGVSADTLAILK